MVEKQMWQVDITYKGLTPLLVAADTLEAAYWLARKWCVATMGKEAAETIESVKRLSNLIVYDIP